MSALRIMKAHRLGSARASVAEPAACRQGCPHARDSEAMLSRDVRDYDSGLLITRPLTAYVLTG